MFIKGRTWCQTAETRSLTKHSVVTGNPGDFQKELSHLSEE